MAVGIAALLIVFLGLEAMVDLVLGLLPQMGEAPLSLNRILSWAVWPFTVLMGLRPEEWQTASQVLGARFVETEVAAYFKLAAVQGATAVNPAVGPVGQCDLVAQIHGLEHRRKVVEAVGPLAQHPQPQIQLRAGSNGPGTQSSTSASIPAKCAGGVL